VVSLTSNLQARGKHLVCCPRLLNQFKDVEKCGHAGRIWEKQHAYRILVGKPDGKRPLGRLRRSWVDKYKMDLKEIGLSGIDWIDLAQDRYNWRVLVNTVMNFRVP
jgi:hypothetical protein